MAENRKKYGAERAKEAKQAKEAEKMEEAKETMKGKEAKEAKETEEAEEAENDEEEHSLPLFLLAAGLFLAVLAAEHLLSLPEWAVCVCYLLPYLLTGFGTLREAAEHLFHGELFGEEVLMSIASLGAFCIGESAEGAAVMLLFCLGEILEEAAVGRTQRSVEALSALRPDTARLLLSDGTEKLCPPEDVSVGADILVRPGERVPLDGVVRAGSASVDTAALTGEAMPRGVTVGDGVSAGCVCLDGVLTVTVTKKAEDSAAARILYLTEHAASRKTRSETFLSRFTRVYTPAVVGAAVLLALVPSVITGEVSVWVHRALTFLVVSCPCALVLSVPLTFFCGIGACSRRGVLVKGSAYLEALSRVTVIASDKTGTLTEGKFSVSELLPVPGVSPETLLETAALAEASSPHPAARCIREAYTAKTGQDIPVQNRKRTDSRELPGRGVSAVLDGKPVLAGNRFLLSENGVSVPDTPDTAGTQVFLAMAGTYLGRIVISDTVKPDAAQAVQAFRRTGVKEIHLLTGDTASSAEAVSQKLGLDDFRAELLPEGKLSAAEELKRRTDGGTLLCIGDGINDAPLLAMADVGAAMGGLGSDAAMEAADVVVMDDRPSRLPQTMALAKKTMRIVRENIAIALCVKAVILLLGALGFAGMWAAVFGDVGVTLLCVLNAARAGK